MGRWIDNFVHENVKQCVNSLSQFGCSPHPIKVGVGLYHVQMGVHGACSVFVFVTQSHVGDGLPIHRQCLNVALPSTVKGATFNVSEQALGHAQRVFAACSSNVLGQTVNRKGDGIDLFFCVKGLPEMV